MNAPVVDAARGDVGLVPGPVPASRAGDTQPPVAAVIAVGIDCVCGFPLVWVRGTQRCAVYGHHADLAAPVRDTSAPGALLVDLVAAAPSRPQTEYQRAYDRRRRLKVVS